MTFQEDQFNNIDKILGIIEESDDDSETDEPTTNNVTLTSNAAEQTPALVDGSEYEKEVRKNIDKFDSIQETASKAFEDLAGVCSSFNKDRSYEVLAKLMDGITNATKAKHELIKDLYKKDDPKNGQQRGPTVNVFTGSFKDLINGIPKTRTIVVTEKQDNETKNNRFELSIRKEDESKLEGFPIEYTIEKKEKLTILVFNSSTEMNKLKFGLIDKFGAGIVL